MCDGYAGAEGKVDESIALMKEVEDLKAKKRMAEVKKHFDWRTACFTVILLCTILCKCEHL